MTTPLSRREFLKLNAAAISALAFRPPPQNKTPEIFGWGRVTATYLSHRTAPAFTAQRLGYLPKDQIIEISEEIEAPDGPTHNPRWYRTGDGFVHSGYVQRVETHLQKAILSVRPEGQLAEITIPYTQSLQLNRDRIWTPLYRLYYSSLHWITAVEAGPDENSWYQITDDRLKNKYYVPAAHMRVLSPYDLTPISPHIPASQKTIKVDLNAQTLTAYAFGKQVFHTTISSGLLQSSVPEGEIPTDTPTGNHLVDHKRPVRHMGDGKITSDPEAYELPGVPWVSYFYSLTGVAFHGTYWHDNFGKPMSHGCINMRNEDAKWLFRWTTPFYTTINQGMYQRGKGTHVAVL